MNATMSEIISCSMDNTDKSIFLTIPHEVLVDLLYLLPTSSVINFYLVSSTHLRLFDSEHGFWEQLTRKIFKWSNNALPSQNQGSNNINWKKEYRVASYFDSLIRSDQIHPVPSHTDLSLLQTLSKNHFKAENTVASIENMSYCTLQSQTKLYPLPIGNFSTAYYEMEAISIDDSGFDLVIGGAIKGFVGYVGTGITSYGYANDGGIYLECELTPVEEPEEFKVSAGDTIGFGINFVKKSVFFTKNGKLIHEVDKNFDDKPLLELMNLHATISIDRHEVKVNMGSAPFEFDLLKYQQQHAQRPLELYSNIVVKHLLSAIELTDDILADTSLYYNDNNIPDFEYNLPEVFYILLYCRLPPNSKYFNSNDANAKQMTMQMTMLRVVLNSAKMMLNMKSKQTQVASMMVADMLQGFQIENASSKSWEEQVMAACNCAIRNYSEILLHIVVQCAEEITELAYSKSKMALWATYLLAVAEYYRPGGMDHWTKESVLTLLNSNNVPQDQIFPSIVDNIASLKTTFAAPAVLAQRCKHLAQAKVKEKRLMMTVFGKGNNGLAEGYIKLMGDLFKKSMSDPLNFVDNKPYEETNQIAVQVEARYSIDQHEGATPLTAVLYGIYKLKISPNDFASQEDYVREVFKQNKKLITDDTKHKFLLEMQRFANMGLEGANCDSRTSILLPLKAVYNIDIQMDGDTKQIIEQAKKEIERMIETKNYGPANSRRKTARSRGKKVATNNSTNSSLLIIGTVAAIGVIGLGAWWLRKRFAKE